MGCHGQRVLTVIHLYHAIMSADTENADDESEKINVRVPRTFLQMIDEEYKRRGYATRSEAIRDALRDWIEPSVTLSEDTLEALAMSREQRENGETMGAADVRERLGLDD